MTVENDGSKGELSELALAEARKLAETSAQALECIRTSYANVNGDAPVDRLVMTIFTMLGRLAAGVYDEKQHPKEVWWQLLQEGAEMFQAAYRLEQHIGECQDCQDGKPHD